jgi:hypothetical protein
MENERNKGGLSWKDEEGDKIKDNWLIREITTMITKPLIILKKF